MDIEALSSNCLTPLGTLDIVNNKTSVQVITHKNAGGTVLGTFTMTAGSVELVEKVSTDTLTGAATSLAVKVAYTK